MPNYTYTVDPNAAVKNKIGATTHDDLERLEGDLVAARGYELDAGYGPTGAFDIAHLKAIHRHLFQDVYEWAGHTRAEPVTLSDGTVATEPLLRKPDGQPFTAGPLTHAALARIALSPRRSNHLRGLPRPAFTRKATDVMVALNAFTPSGRGTAGPSARSSDPWPSRRGTNWISRWCRGNA